jgi:hypothetical protein
MEEQVCLGSKVALSAQLRAPRNDNAPVRRVPSRHTYAHALCNTPPVGAPASAPRHNICDAEKPDQSTQQTLAAISDNVA